MSPQRRRAFYLLLVAGAVAGLTAFGLTLSGRLSSNDHGIVTNRALIQAACVRVNRLEQVIRLVLTQSLNTLGAKGTPGYVYYRAHPDELAAGRASIRHEIAEFSGKC